MSNIDQSSKGNNNIQIGINNGEVIKTEKIIRKVEVIHDKEDCITPAQALELRNKIVEIGTALALDKKMTSQKAYGGVYSKLYKRFKIHKYDLLPKDKFDEAIKWLQKEYATYAMPKLRNADEETWRKQKYTAINAKYRQLGMSKEEFYIFANEALGLKKPFQSITELSRTSIEKLYRKLWAKTKK